MVDTTKLSNFDKLKLGLLIIIPVVLLILPANVFDDGQSICLSMLLLDIECYACGLTRASQHFIHFDFQTAMEYNKLVVIVVPLLSLLWLKEILNTLGIRFLSWL